VDASPVPAAIAPLALEGAAVAEPDELAQRSHRGNCVSLNEIEQTEGGKMQTAGGVGSAVAGGVGSAVNRIIRGHSACWFFHDLFFSSLSHKKRKTYIPKRYVGRRYTSYSLLFSLCLSLSFSAF
jgi:hypothetical protein